MASSSQYSPAPDPVTQMRMRFARYSDDDSGGLIEEPSNHVSSPVSREQPNAMTQPTREEIDAKLEAMEARMDGRVASIQSSMDVFLVRQDERFVRLDDRLGRMEQDVTQTQTDVKGLKSTIIITAISTALAIVFGVAAFNATVLSNMVASFESGKNTATSQAEVKKQLEETAQLLKKIQEDQAKSTEKANTPKQKSAS